MPHTRRSVDLTRTRHMQPIVIGAFALTENGLEVNGNPSFGEYEGAGDFIKRAHKASGWWLADWIVYGESREDWKEQIDALIDVEALTEQSVRQYRYIAKSVPKARRLKGVPFGHHAEVASLSADEQCEWLARAKTEGWTAHELRKHIRAQKRTKVIEGQAVLEGMFRVIYADPPWLYGDRGATADGSLGKAERHFRGMPIADPGDFFDEKMDLRPMKDLAPAARSAVAGLEVIIKNAKAGDNMTDLIHKLKWWDKLKALELLMKNLGILEEKVSIARGPLGCDAAGRTGQAGARPGSPGDRRACFRAGGGSSYATSA